MNSHAQIGIIGLGAMGQGLALNIAEKGYRISVFNRHLDGVEENVAQDFMAKTEHRETMGGFDELDSFVQSLAAPRKILLLVSAGAAVDEVIENLTPFLKAGDLIIDGGNSHHRDTEQRLHELKTMNTSANHTSITVKHASSAETNCGRKATKKSNSLGLRTFNSAPLIITRIAETLAFSSASQKVWPSRRMFQAI